MNKSTVALCTGITLASASAVPPTIHVSWSEPGPPPVLDQDYRVITTAPASSDYPNVELIKGSLTWWIWSTDPDPENPLGVGDIGVISCPHPDNFKVTILNGALRGARHVKGITLEPAGTDNFSELVAAINGDLLGDLRVNAGGTTGEGGTATVYIDGSAYGFLKVPRTASLWIASQLAAGATLEIHDLYAGAVVVGYVIGDVLVDRIRSGAISYADVRKDATI